MVAAGIPEGISKIAACLSRPMHKKAAVFNFGDGPDNGIDWGGILIPLIAAAAAGTIGYKSGINGHKDQSAFENTKNYIGNTARALIRKGRRPMYDIGQYL